LDLYSLHRSMHAVVAYLETVDPQAADRARERYSCFDRFGDEVEGYARTVGYGLSPSCREEALAQLLEMQRHEFSAASAGATTDGERRFVAEQNARVVASAEAYYRTMLDADISLQSARKAIEYLRTELGTDLASAHLVLDGGNTVLVQTGDQIVDLLRNGQGVLNIVALGPVVDDLATELEQVEPEERVPAAETPAVRAAAR